jgi:chromosome segregation ATPase
VTPPRSPTVSSLPSDRVVIEELRARVSALECEALDARLEAEEVRSGAVVAASVAAAETETLRAEVDTLRNQRDVAVRKAAAVHGDARDAESRAARQHESLVRELTAEREDLARRLSASAIALAEERARVDGLEGTVHDLSQALARERETSTTSRRAVDSALGSMRRSQELLGGEAASLRAQVTVAETSAETLRARVAALEPLEAESRALRARVKGLESTEREAAVLRDRVASLQSVIGTLRGEVGRVCVADVHSCCSLE